jgi:hypothetical protein
VQFAASAIALVVSATKLSSSMEEVGEEVGEEVREEVGESSMSVCSI